MKVLVVSVLLSLVAFSAVVIADDQLYSGCHCITEWNDANRVGNWTVPENWLQLQEPSQVSFVNISGSNTIHVNEDRVINNLLLGENRWDETRLVIDETLTITYDASPVITSVRGYRQTNGQIRLVLEGKGFGFESSEISVMVFSKTINSIAEVDDDDVERFKAGETVEDAAALHSCEDPTLEFRDNKVSCYVTDLPDPDLHAFYVRLSVEFPFGTRNAQYAILSKYIQ